MKVKMSGGPASLQLKLVLLVIALLIAAGTLIYTQSLVKDLQEREREIVELYASSFKSVAGRISEGIDFSYQLEIIKRINFPVILAIVDSSGNISDSILAHRNIVIDENLSEEQVNRFLVEQGKYLQKLHEPIPIFFNNSNPKQAIFYGDSHLVTKIKYYPYLQILFAIIFILISYISFSYLKKAEQSNIWVGMAKETAHQLGTPISSLMGWQEILKMSYDKADTVMDVAYEMDNDLKRLNKIANRFSKIGSKPELKEEVIDDVISKVINYFNRRLPQFSKKVDIEIQGDSSLTCKMNSDLFEWVIENLVKNALDAIDSNVMGVIKISYRKSEDQVQIEIADNGKGIDLRRKSDVFRPGYSTKKRGWGLGLSLARRIIENYHKGKIFVKNSSADEGTTFQINLPS